MRPRTIFYIVLSIVILAAAHHPIGQAIALTCEQFTKFGHLIENGKFSLR